MAIAASLSKTSNFIKGLSNNRNKYFAIKDANRRANLHKANFFFKILNVLSFIIFYLGFALTAFFALMALITLFKVATFSELALYSVIATGGSLLIIIVLTLLNYLVDGIFIKKEMKELKVELAEEDKKYIDIGNMFLKLRKTYFICLSIFIVLVGVTAVLIIFDLPIYAVIVGIISVIPMFVYLSKVTKGYRSISAQIQEVIEERRELKKLSK